VTFIRLQVRFVDELLPPCATNERRDFFRCCGEDEGRPLGVAFQKEASNRPLLLRPKGVVVSEWETRGVTTVGMCKEMSVSEPLTICRKSFQSLSKPVEERHYRDQPARCLITAQVATGIKAA